MFSVTFIFQIKLISNQIRIHIQQKNQFLHINDI